MPRTKSERRIYAALAPFSTVIDGVPITFDETGPFVVEDDPVYRNNQDKFQPVEIREYRRVEQATAAPGEVRG